MARLGSDAFLLVRSGESMIDARRDRQTAINHDGMAAAVVSIYISLSSVLNRARRIAARRCCGFGMFMAPWQQSIVLL